MKNITYIITSMLILALLSACGNTPERPAAILDQTRIDAANSEAAAAVPEASNVAIGNTAGLPHYYCPNKCEGSGGDAAGACPVCGTAYAHNDSFHNQGASTTPTTGAIANNVTSGNNIQTQINNPAQKAPEPPQNADGVWHYTCPNGCAGGGGAVAPCAGCGSDLTHNTAYHN